MTVMFFGILVILAILSAIAIYAVIREERSNNKLISEQKERLEKIKNELTGKNLELEKGKNQILEIEELQTQIVKLNKDLTASTEMYKGLKGQYDELERDMEKLQQELANKDATLKTEQMAHQEIKEKYEALLKTTYGSKVEKEGDERQMP